MNYCKHLKKRKNKPYCDIIRKEITLSQCRECDNKEYRVPVNGKIDKMKNKSNKLARMERKRKSVFTSNMDKCYFCDNPRMDKHEIYRGKNRANSMKFGFVLPLCRVHHNMYQDDILFNEHWHKKAQQYFEERYGNRDDFISIFRRNYLK